MSYRRPNSIFGPLIVIAIGVLLLLRHHLPGFVLGEFIARYWPALLILWGLVRLVEFYSAPPEHRRLGFSGSEILLVVFIIVVGMSFTGIYHIHMNGDWGWNDNNFGWGWGDNGWPPWVETHTFSATVNGVVKPGTPVLVRGFSADVDVEPGSGDRIAIGATDTVRGSQSEAQAAFQRGQPVIGNENGAVTITSVPQGMEDRIRASLKITLPPSCPLTLESRSGNQSVLNWAAPVTVASDHGDVNLNGVKGDVQVTAHHGSVTIGNVTGAARVEGAGSDVNLSDISGPVTIQGDYDGSLTFQHLPKGLDFVSSRTDMHVERVTGSIFTDMGDLRIQDAAGIKVRTRNKDIEVRGFTGGLDVHDQHGQIDGTAEKPPSAPIVLSTRDGDITLNLPPASSFTLSATDRRGSIDSDFPLQITQAGNTSQAQGSFGSNGPAITLDTSNASIELRKAEPSAEPAAPPPPKPPKRPQAPAET
jgi:DUF4097 and DUF4098 domain-containing protein YvlB